MRVLSVCPFAAAVFSILLAAPCVLPCVCLGAVFVNIRSLSTTRHTPISGDGPEARKEFFGRKCLSNLTYGRRLDTSEKIYAKNRGFIQII